jgi:hypothetical protein
MAARYWVGGAGNWSSTTKWSTSSGGASGASVPTSADDAIFDANSGGKFVATVDTAQQVNSLTITPSAGAGILQIAITVSLTTGALTTTGTAGNNRIWFRSTTYGISTNLIVNGAASIFDCDFRGVYVTGTSAPISGTRIGNRGECRGITFDAPKTVYWNLAGAQNWSATGWAATSGGAPSTDNFPLPQDTATFNNAGSVTGVISLDAAIGYVGSVDMSARTSAMTLSVSNATTVYGNWTNGSGTTISNLLGLTFSGGGTQTITSAGKTFTCPIAVNTYGGTVKLADALDIGTNTLTVTNGTFNTQGYAVTLGTLTSTNTNVRTISLGASTLSFSSTLNFLTSTNLTFNAGTSLLQAIGTSMTFNGGGLVFYNVSFTNNAFSTHTITGSNTYNNLTFTSPVPAGVMGATFSDPQTINGTLNCSGASAVNRLFLRSDTVGTSRTLAVNLLSATDCDFRDITIAGAAAGSSPTRAGNCGGNSGITFPSPKTVYWNLAGAQNWSATGWATSSGGAPAVNNFPLAQDTAVFDNTGSVTGTITINAAWNIGTFDASARTSAMSLSAGSTTPVVYGDWKFGTGVTALSSAGSIAFAKNGTSTITSNGVQFSCFVSTINPLVTVRLADAFSLISTSTLILTYGTFDAVTYNVTIGALSCTNSSGLAVVKMGSGTWTLTGTGTVWGIISANTLIAGTANIVLSNTSTTARTFDGGSRYYNKLTIGGTTGTSTLTITGSNTFGELASTKTVAHTITFQSSVTHTIGKWSVTGTAGNVVTLAPFSAASTYTLVIAGPANSGIDYLSISYCAVSTSSPGEFYVGANSTNTAGNTGPIFFTATPAPRTLYWVGGTGNWSSTTKWSTSSGGVSGAAIPTSLDAVNFDSLSNATAYTATIDAGLTAIAKCASFTMAGPATGNVTFAGTVAIAFHGNVSFAATGITRTYTGAMSLAGNSSYTFTTNGQALSSIVTVIGVGATWTLGSAFSNANSFTVTYGSFSTSGSNYSFSPTSLASSGTTVRSLSLNASTVPLAGNMTFTIITNLTFNAGTSSISISTTAPTFAGGGLTFYNVSFTSAAATSITITGVNTFNTLSFAGQTTVGICAVTFNANQTISTLTLNAGTAAAYRTFLASDTLGTQRTLSVGTLTAGAADYDFRDIAITGAASPIAPTRAGDCKGNSGITFPAAKTVYFAVAASSNWGSAGSGSWSGSNNGIPNVTQFPLAQDTAIFPSTPTAYPTSGNIVTVNANYNIGTIDMSARTANTMTLATGTTTPAIYGNWINGTGTTLTGSNNMTFAGRGSQTITSAGVTFTQVFTISSPTGSVTLQDALVCSGVAPSSLTISAGTFDAASYSVSLSGGGLAATGTGFGARSIAFGTGTWTIAFAGTAVTISATANIPTIAGTGTISLTSASSKTFAGGGISYSGITLNNGGAGALTVTGNNTLKDITNSYSATGAATISLGATITTLAQFTGTGAAAKLLTLSGTSAAAPATLILTSGTVTTPDYLSISNVRAYSLSSTWYAGANSTNLGSLGWIFASSGGVVYAVYITETGIGADSITAGLRYSGAITETATGTQTNSAIFSPLSRIIETATGTDSDSAQVNAQANISETSTAADSILSKVVFLGQVADSATASDLIAAARAYAAAIAETAAAADQISAAATFRAQMLDTATGMDMLNAHAQFAATVLNTATGTDVVAALTSVLASLSESAAASDLVAAIKVMNSLLLEGATVADAVTAAGSVYLAATSDSALATQTNSAAAGFLSAFSDSATGTQINSTTFDVSARVSETVTGTDAGIANAGFATQILELGTVADLVLVAPSVFNAAALAAASATDSFDPAGSVYYSAVPEMATAYDYVIAAYLWNPIDDTQVPNWQNINNSQAAGWQDIEDTQSPSWQSINNTQSAGWQDIDDTQAPDWQDIKT